MSWFGLLMGLDDVFYGVIFVMVFKEVFDGVYKCIDFLMVIVNFWFWYYCKSYMYNKVIELEIFVCEILFIIMYLYKEVNNFICFFLFLKGEVFCVIR